MKDRTEDVRDTAIARLAEIAGLPADKAERLAGRINAVNRMTDAIYRAQRRAERGIAQMIENAREEEADHYQIKAVR